MYQITITLNTTLTVSSLTPSIITDADTQLIDMSLVRVSVPTDRPPVRTVVLTIPRRWFGVFADGGMGWSVWRYIPARRLMLQEVIAHEVYETLAATPPTIRNAALRIFVTALPQHYPIRVPQRVDVQVLSDYPENIVITNMGMYTRSLTLDSIKRLFPSTYLDWSIIASDVHERIAGILAQEGLPEEEAQHE